MKKHYGYTLVELLIATGVLSLAAIGIYAVAHIVSDLRKSSQEVKSLNILFKEIDNATITTGKYTGIGLGNLPSGHFTSAIGLASVNSPSETKLNFEYKDISSRICTDFTSKMLSSSKNISGIVNGKTIQENNLNEIVSACDANYGKNDVIIVLNKDHDAYTIDTVTASVNLPPPPPPDIAIPDMPIPKPIPQIPEFIPSTANPGTSNIGTGKPPTFGPIAGGGGSISITPGTNQGNQIKPPTWNPPKVNIPSAIPAPPDKLDQDPNPPPPPPPPPLIKSKTIMVYGAFSQSIVYTLTMNKADDSLGIVTPAPYRVSGWYRNYYYTKNLENISFSNKIVDDNIVTYMSLKDFDEWNSIFIEEIERGS